MSKVQDQSLDVQIEFEENEWPKIIDTYVHGSKEYGSMVGEEIGLTGDALDMFSYLNYEVKLTIKVWKTGNYEIIAVDDFPVGSKV